MFNSRLPLVLMLKYMWLFCYFVTAILDYTQIYEYPSKLSFQLSYIPRDAQFFSRDFDNFKHGGFETRPYWAYIQITLHYITYKLLWFSNGLKCFFVRENILNVLHINGIILRLSILKLSFPSASLQNMWLISIEDRLLNVWLAT